MASTGGGSPAKENGFSGLRGVGGRVTNKVRLREDDPSDEGGMCIDTSERGRISFKDSLLDSFRNVEVSGGDAVKENVRGVPTIKIFKRVHHLAEQSMMRTFVLKLENRV
ncbi:hypothetical protein GOBAR_AA01786 [Gossypium barbadense]|uniref:Thioredoxin domain-containing protein n=1 Tax=Gossypium barbadense TaxID=3634 RepID=A0A2P5YT85_GOSBA|nr:hypothetical protein GOBAR_AA01786 [Gossypium barbadense]